jgi:hypothetical protein
MIHRVGSFDRFRQIVKRAITTENSSKGLKKQKAIHVGQDNRTADFITAPTLILAPRAQPDKISALKKMMKRVRDDV